MPVHRGYDPKNNEQIREDNHPDESFDQVEAGPTSVTAAMAKVKAAGGDRAGGIEMPDISKDA
jgi:hypothetical protein